MENNSVLEYEHDVYAIERIEMLLHAMSRMLEHDEHLVPTFNYLCDLLHHHSKRINKLFELSIQQQRQLRGGEQ